MNRRLFGALRAYFDLPVIAQLPAIPVLGSLIDGPGGAAYLNALANAAAPMTVRCASP